MVLRYRTLLFPIAIVGLLGCDSGTAPVTQFYPRLDRETCELSEGLLLSITDWDAIPSIDDPVFVSASSPFAEYLAPDDRVVGFFAGDHAYAVPHNVLWHHEIVNFDSPVGPLAITYCPLTGSSIAYSRVNAGSAGFGVTGFLFRNNLVMFDRNDANSVWVQMQGEASCGPRAGLPLEDYPVFEMRWERWLELNPDTRVMSESQGLVVAYNYESEFYPYEDYESYDNDEFLFPAGMPELDRRREVKERVLGVRAEAGAPPMAYPFDALTALDGDYQVIPTSYRNQDAVVLWDDHARGGMLFYSRTDSGQVVDLAPGPTGFLDDATGSVFSVDGVARSGPLVGDHLFPIADAFEAFWGAWAAFNPGTALWEGA